MSLSIPAAELLPLFDALPEVVFFIKDRGGRYTHVNQTLLRRLRAKRLEEVLGKRTTELFPTRLGDGYASQDGRVLGGETIANQLEVHLFPNRAPGWCLTCKRPLRDGEQITGVIGISRDLGQPDRHHPTYPRLRQTVEYMQAHFAERVRVATLAQQAGISVAQLERHFRRIFQLAPQQFLTKLRIEAAMGMLAGAEAISTIALACGFVDQSAFSRQFKQTAGVTPRDFRRRVGRNSKKIN